MCRAHGMIWSKGFEIWEFIRKGREALRGAKYVWGTQGAYEGPWQIS